MEVSRRLQQPWVSSVAIFIVFVSVWGWFTAGSSGGVSAADAEYARLSGQSAPGQQAGAIPSPWIVALRGRDLITHAFDHDNPNNLGIAWHLAYSMGRVALGFTLALSSRCQASCSVYGLLAIARWILSFRSCGRYRHSRGCRWRSIRSVTAPSRRSSSSSSVRSGRC